MEDAIAASEEGGADSTEESSEVNPGGATPEKVGGLPPAEASPDFAKALRGFGYGSGGSVLFCLSAVSILYGLYSIAGPVLGSSDILSETLPAIGAINLYQLCLFGVLLALATVWKITDDTVSLVILTGVFLVAAGILVSTVSNDDPLVVMGVGGIILALACAQLGALKRWVGVPMPALMILGAGILLAWNSLSAPFIAYVLQDGAQDSGFAEKGWRLSALGFLAAAFLFYLTAMLVPTGDARRVHERVAFLRSPGMMWAFTSTLVAGAAVHEYALLYIFDLPFYLVDFIPLFGLVALTTLETMRAYGRPLNLVDQIVAILPLVATLLAISWGSHSPSGPGVGLLWPPAYTFAGMFALMLASFFRHPRRPLTIVMVLYALAIVLVVGVDTAPGQNGLRALNWETFGIFSVLALLVFMISIRNPLLGVAALACMVAYGPHEIAMERIASLENLSIEVKWAFDGMLAGLGLVLLHLLFAQRLHRWFAVGGAALFAISVLSLAEGDMLFYPLYLLMAYAALNALILWRTRDLLASIILCAPLVQALYLGLSSAGGWRYISLSFVLLALGAAWSVKNRSPGGDGVNADPSPVVAEK